MTDTNTESNTIAQLARAGTNPKALAPGGLYAVPDADGEVRVLDLEEYAPVPHRKKGSTVLRDAASFSAVVNKHRTEGTEIYADPKALRVRAILDAPTSDQPGWGGHTATLTLSKTDGWKAWEQIDKKLLSQDDFAEFVEQRIIDVQEPSGADLLELAQTFKATKAVNFESSKRLSSGVVNLVYAEAVDAKAGTRGQIEIPEQITLGLAPFDGALAYKMTARLRYRIDGGTLRLGIVLDRPSEILEAAFADQSAAIEKSTGITVWLSYLS